ncbi:MAG TPA: non-reducing end alpha-L-arabinofuranosidase family hydrolase [Polyangia bacterium]
MRSESRLVRLHSGFVAKAALLCLLLATLPSCLRPPAKVAPTVANLAPAAAPAPVSTSLRAVPGLPAALSWTSSNPVIVPTADAKHELVAVKDPTIVRFNDRWHVYASSVAKGGIYGMVYTSFADWSEAPKASFYYMDKTPGFNTYVAAPQLFYFAPQKTWYLVFQSGPPMFSTAPDPSDPSKWAAPQPFFPKPPEFIEKTGGWLDFWVICDEAYCHLFFSNDHGRFYKSKTPVDKFPRGFDTPVVVMEDPEAGRLFEACNVYKMNGTNTYLALVEAFDKTSNFRRYFRSWTAPSLEGPWTVLHDNATAPFVGKENVIFEGAPWSDDISHGELIRAGYDQTMVIDGGKFLYLYQGFAPGTNTSDYNGIPWQLGLLTSK